MPPAPAILPLAPDDWPTLRALRLAALSDTPTAFGSTFAEEALLTDADWIERARQRTTGLRAATFIARTECHPQVAVGIAAGVLNDADPALAHLISMWVAPPARRTGTSLRLVHAVLDWARSRGVTTVTLSVTVGNTAAERLYARAGFVPTDHVHPHRAYPGLSMRDMARRMD